jgi:hypothetical protein
MADPSNLIVESLDLGRVSDVTLKTIVAELEQSFPDVCPEHTVQYQEFTYRAGQISVVRYLKSKLQS